MGTYEKKGRAQRHGQSDREEMTAPTSVFAWADASEYSHKRLI